MKKHILIAGLFFCYLVNFSQEQTSFYDVRDHKTYKIIKINTQTWFGENLAYKPTTGNYWAYNNNDSNMAKNGYLYNWETAKNVCPRGWHLLSEAEWKTLIDYLGGTEIAGSKMRDTTGWLNYAMSNSTNSSGFSALPSGLRIYNDDVFEGLGKGCNFWSSTLENEDHAVTFDIRYYDNNCNHDKYSISGGFSVRCIKN